MHAVKKLTRDKHIEVIRVVKTLLPALESSGVGGTEIGMGLFNQEGPHCVWSRKALAFNCC
jgi:hypothetical protein